MKRNTLNFVMDVVLAVLAAGMIGTGLVMRYILPPGSGQWRLLWGLGRHDWGDLHFWLAAGIGGVLLVHLALHWQWVCTTLMRLVRRKDEGGTRVPSALRRNLIGVTVAGLVVAAFCAFLWVANASVTEARGSEMGARGGPAREAVAGDFITGSMSLSDVAKATGMTVEGVRERLGVPASVSADERMGRLGRSYGFTIPEAREKLAGRAGK